MFIKSASKKFTIKNIVTLNIYTKEQYILKSNIFSKLQSFTHNRLNFITSYMSTKDMINTKVYISRTVAEEDILDCIDTKAYEELGLDEASSYVISSMEVFSDGEEREFQLFVVETEVLNKYFEEIEEKTKFIDLITPAPLLFKSLFTHEILTSVGVQGFIYFTRKDAFVTFYKEGEYLYSKSMEYSLNSIYNKYCALIGEKVDEEDFYSLLVTEGLNTTKLEYQEDLMKIFADILIAINDIMVYTKRVFNLTDINHLYIGSVLGTIVGLEVYSQNYLQVVSSSLTFDYAIKTDMDDIDQLHYLMLLNTYDYLEDEEEQVNLTIYPRPPSFMNRSSGQVISLTLIALFLSLIMPFFYLFGAYSNDSENFFLKTQDDQLTIEANKYRGILGRKKEVIKDLDEKTNIRLNRYNMNTQVLTEIYDKKVNYQLKSEILYLISEELNQFDLKIDNLEIKNNTIWISMIGDSERQLTELIKYISDKYFKDIHFIDIQKINKDVVNKQYKGLLKMELK